MKSYFLLLINILLLVFAGNATAQNSILQRSIYFKSAKSNLTDESKAVLDQLADTLKNFYSYKIFIKGNTDNIGDSIYNKSLSDKRVRTTQYYFISKEILPGVFSTFSFGEAKPVADNITDEGRQKNRRVDIVISYIAAKAIIPSLSISDATPTIWDLYKQTEVKPQEFTIDVRKDTSFRSDNGTIVVINANTFKIPAGCKTKTVTFKIKQDVLKSDMILDNLSTTSNGEALESQGMVYTEATDCKGNKVDIIKGKTITILLPTDTVIEGAKIFDGDRTPHDSIMNWTLGNTSALADFTMSDISACSDWMCGGVKYKCETCKFGCRFKRIGKVLKGIASKNARTENKGFRECQRQLKKERASAKNQNANSAMPQSTTVRDRPLISPVMLTKCSALEGLFKKYGVTNSTQLFNAIYKPIMDSLHVKTYAELQDTLAKISERKVELAYRDKKISFDDFKYYVFNVSKLGWKNLDIFANLPNTITMKINLEIRNNVDCKLVFSNRNVIIPASKTEGKYIFEKVPKGERAWIVALKYEKDQPFLSMEKISIDKKTYEVNFQKLTLEELKKQLSKLNK